MTTLPHAAVAGREEKEGRNEGRRMGVLERCGVWGMHGCGAGRWRDGGRGPGRVLSHAAVRVDGSDGPEE